MDQMQPNALPGREVALFEDFCVLHTRVEQLEADNRSLRARVTQLEAERNSAPHHSTTRHRPGATRAPPEVYATPTKKKEDDDDDEVEDVIFVKSQPATPHPPPVASAKPELGPQTKAFLVYLGRHMKFIQRLDFFEENVLLLPAFKLEDCEVPIFQHIELNDSNVPMTTYDYVVSVGETGPHLETGFRLPSWEYGRSITTHNFIDLKQAFEASVLEVKVKARETSATSLGASNTSHRRTIASIQGSRRLEQLSLPKYVYEIGEVLIISHDVNGPEPSRSTSCHLVVDICSKAKALWLIYRYKGIEKGGQVVKRKRKFDRDDDMFQFVQGGQGFDICQVGESVKDWLQEDGTFKHIHNAQGLIKRTHCQANPELVEPVFEEFLKEMGRGPATT
ncbi:hypothetical protein AB5N19_11673 [Seiridium cardinale]|uniref:Uncharacterized protein n=1 Tax=Seiridium cardinale TaxID=138064 RepID=A0ABR2XE93_9PEZI